MHLVDALFAEAAWQRRIDLVWLLLHLRNQDVLDAFAVCWGLKIVRVNREISTLSFLLWWIVAVLYSNAAQILTIALDLDAVREKKAVKRANFLSQLSVIHVCIHRVSLYLFKTNVEDIFPGNALVYIRKVFSQFTNCHLSELRLKSYVAVRLTCCFKTVKLDTIRCFLFEFPVSPVQQINKLVSWLAPNFDVLDSLIWLDLIQIKLEIFERITRSTWGLASCTIRWTLY